MKRNKSLVHTPRVASTELAPSAGAAPDQHPVRVYLASLEAGSRPAMLSGLHAIARLVKSDTDAYTLPWQGLRFQHTAAIRAALMQRYEPRTVNRMLASVRGVLKAAWRLGQITSDEYMRAIDIKGAKVGTKPAGRALTEEEFVKLVRAARAGSELARLRDQAMLVLLYKAGLRRAEISALDVGSMQSDKQTIDVWGKGDKHRYMYLSEGNWGYVEPWVADRRNALQGVASAPTAPLFCSLARGHFGERLSPAGVHVVIKGLADDAGVKDVDVHDMRRSFATAMLDAGVDLLQLQALMGHADLKTTKIYDRRGEKGKRAAVELLTVLDLDNKEI